MIYGIATDVIPPYFYNNYGKYFKDFLGDLYNKYYAVSFLPRDISYASCLFHSPLRNTDVILDVGGACSYFMHSIARFAREAYIIDPLLGFDACSQWKSSLSEFQGITNFSFIEQSATEIPFPDNYFDKIYTISALEHCYIENDDLAIVDEIKRTLKTGGIFTGTVDFNPVTETPFGVDDICRAYTHKALYERIIDRSGMVLAGRDYEKDRPIPESGNGALCEMFFKLIKPH